MANDRNFQRCLDLVAKLNDEHGWRLTVEMQRHYAQQIVAFSPGMGTLTDLQLCRIIGYYHTEHHLVEALLDQNHHLHEKHWSEWAGHVMRILISKGGVPRRNSEQVVSLEDLQQEAMADLWNGLRTFRYQSRLQTWAFTVVTRCLSRYYRGAQTQKRSALPPAQSLDALVLADGDTLPDQSLPGPDETAMANTLAMLLEQVLAQHPDQRLNTVFWLWAAEDKTLREIGELLNLSAPRVDVLLSQALTLLRSEASVRAWVDNDATVVDPSPASVTTLNYAPAVTLGTPGCSSCS